MSKKKSATVNQVDQEAQAKAEQFTRSLHRRLENKNWREIAEGIIWAINSIHESWPEIPEPDPDPVYEAPKVSGEASVDMNAVEAAIRKILAERDAEKDTSPE